MMRRSLRLGLLGPVLAVATIASCKPAAVDDGAGAGGTASATPAATAAGAEHGHEAAGGAADDHEARPLRTIMQGLTVDMQGFARALFVADSAAMVAHAAAMAGHAVILPEDLRRIQAALGTEMAAFEAADERVHLAAERLHELAIAGQLDAAARQVGEVSQGCVACHSQFRERLRTDR